MCAGRIARRMPWSRVTLRRGSDRIQAWLTVVLLVGGLIGAPWVAWRAASTTYRDGVRAGAWEKQHHHRVPAVLAQDASSRVGVAVGGEAPPAPAIVSAPASWTGPDGLPHAGAVSVDLGARAGSTVTVWVDDHGTLVMPPRRRYPVVGATVAGTLALIGLTALLSGVRRLVVWRLDHRRLRAWEAEWLIVGPLWSRR